MTSGRLGFLLVGGSFIFKRTTNLIAPIFLVRMLDVNQYGEYRLFWLIATSVMLFAPLGMPRGLLYFLPRSTNTDKRCFVSQTILFLAVTGFLGALAVGPWGPLFPDDGSNSYSFGYLLTGFVFLWVVTSLLTVLPSANQDYKWHALSIVWLTVIRNVIVVVIAAWTADLGDIYAGLTLFAFFKLLLLFYYCFSRYGRDFFKLDLEKFKEQLRFSIPFGFSSVLTQLQGKVEQWIVVFLFPLSTLALFSIVKNIESLVGVIRKSMGQVIMPKMSRSDSKGREDRALILNNRANLTSGFTVFPIIAFLLLFAEPVIEVLYTAQYLDAAPVMRILLISMAFSTVDVANLLMIYKQKRFVMKVSLLTLAIASVGGYFGGQVLGLIGVALGSAAGMIVGKILRFIHICNVLDIPLAQLQDWKSLFSYFSVSLVSALLAFGIFRICPCELLFIRLAVSGIAFAIFYTGILAATGHGQMILILLGKKRWTNP